jgi:glyoxylate reductase
MKKTVYISRRIPPEALEIIAAACEYRIWDEAEIPVPRDVLLREVAAVDGIFSLLSERIDAELLAAAPHCRVVANMAVGYDNIDVGMATARGVLITNTPGVLTATTADLSWALMLAAGRRLVEGQKLIEAGNWRYWSPMFMVGQDISGATLGIVGAGRIGSAIARRAAGFEMRILYHNRRPDPQLEAQTGARYRDFAPLLAEADFVVVALPLTAETRGMFDAAAFARMKPTAVFVNIARGAIVDEEALYQALRQGRPWAAGLDVFAHEPIGAEHPLLSLPNVVAVPHIGSASIATRTRMATTAARNLIAALNGQVVPNPVNPEVLPAAQRP